MFLFSSNRRNWFHWRTSLFLSLLSVVLLVGCAEVPSSSPVPTITSTPSVSKISRFPLPDKLSNPTGITSGPDGALWFTETSAGKIGRVTVQGKISEFPLPTADSHPYDITSG
ncbi:MAG: hypothetical protein J2P36_34280, partial [Ktedonobacteraceae bacterium]|nr:hypothetical protein [Ktedonobacteraceae bacterium]